MNCSYGFKSVTRKLCITALKFWKKYIIAGKGALHNHSIEDKLCLHLVNSIPTIQPQTGMSSCLICFCKPLYIF